MDPDSRNLNSEQEVSIDQLFNAWQSLASDAIIIDIRKPDDFRTQHIPGSRNLPFGTVAEHVDELKQYSRVYFYCYGGQGSKATTEKLGEMGLKNCFYLGQAGLADWDAAGYPTTRIKIFAKPTRASRSCSGG